MIRIIVLDDDYEAYNTLKIFIDQFSKENNIGFEINYFSNPLSFLDDYTPADLILMDIDMPYLNGIETAEKLRSKDPNVLLIFITNYVQYAIKGYSVNAIDYVLKPVKYARFSSLMSRVLKMIIASKNDNIIIKTTDGTIKLNAFLIISVEVSDHLLIYHTDSKEYEAWGSLKETALMLPSYFERCNHSVIVNLKKVIRLDKNEITLTDGNKYLISQKKKSDFISKLNRFLK